jgi:hypothetical protein
MTQKKTQKTQKQQVVRVDATAWQRLEEDNATLKRRIDFLEMEAKDRIGRAEPTNQESVGATIDGMARARGQNEARRPRRHATPGGPNFPDDIYPPGCGPMQLMWSQSLASGEVILGTQGDSFHHFPNRQAAVSWLLGVAQRIINDKIPER